MSRPNPQTLSAALTAMRRFFVDFDNSKYTRVLPLERYIQTINDGGLNKALIKELEHVKFELYTQTREQIYYGRRPMGPYETQEKALAELDRVIILLRDALDPEPPEAAEPPRLDTSAFIGGELVKEKSAPYAGDPALARVIFEQSVALVRRHTEALGRGDFAGAYEDLNAKLKEAMSLKRFEAVHAEASERYSGPPSSFGIEHLMLILADEQSRKKTTQAQGWPKDSEKETRRVKVIGFWYRKEQQYGCYGTFWITEEAGNYRIAKFSFWSM
ncbi:MAG TPA: hypothetical protein VGH19_22980 [Verrucomicrobiae bacterium]